MSLRTQSKVLRVLEEQRFERVGSNETLSVDVRVIAATNKHLEQEIARGAFRQDLFYRLNVIPFYVPALRDRKQDIPTLARYFLSEFSSAYGKKTRELTDSAMEVLIRYPWPGNVRELRNLVERLVIVCPRRVSSRITSRPNSSAAPRKAPIIPTRRCTKLAAPMSGNSSCGNCRSTAGT